MRQETHIFMIFLAKFLCPFFSKICKVTDIELLRKLATLRRHFHNFWNIAFSTIKTIVFLVKAEAFYFF